LAALIERKGERYDALLAGHAVVFPAAVSCIGRLTGAGVPLAIASGALAPEIVHILERAGLRHHFRVIVASGDTPASKPAPDPYARAADLLAGTIDGSAATSPPRDRPRSSFVAIEDSHWGLVSARDAGLRTIAVTTTYPASALRAADVVVPGLDDVTLDLLERLCS
jgi:beta-phosphoglucomutase-like phosphatase (HAD superfamily)